MIRDIQIGQLVWLMVLNKPVQLKVSKIIKTDELTAATDEPQVRIKAFASYSKEYKHEQELNLSEVFETKEELQDSLFKEGIAAEADFIVQQELGGKK